VKGPRAAGAYEPALLSTYDNEAHRPEGGHMWVPSRLSLAACSDGGLEESIQGATMNQRSARSRSCVDWL